MQRRYTSEARSESINKLEFGSPKLEAGQTAKMVVHPTNHYIKHRTRRVSR